MSQQDQAIKLQSRAGAGQHLRRLEAESIYIFREVAAECRAPVLMYSIGKDSSVLLHLAMKAFYPAKPPFPMLHIDTGWKFREMIAHRDAMARRYGIPLIVHTNKEGQARGINPFDHGGHYTHVMKTEALKQALDAGGFDAAFGGARRDEEKSRAKERIFSFRDAAHGWDPKNQRPEFWNLYNSRINPGESIRVFPLSNWTELDVWEYIAAEEIPVVPLYFTQTLPVVERQGVLIVAHDERMRLEEGEVPVSRRVRFRSLGCYPLTAAVPSDATSLADIIAEVRDARESERGGRLIDRDENSSMERKKREGYF
jgi:sulfate adenylyltransferase subunit 2